MSIQPKWRRALHQVDQLEDEIRQLDDGQLRKRSLALRYDVLSGRSLDEILPVGFALVREAARRSIGMTHYPVQMLGGIAMHHGAVAVMQTGEGKTLTATLPLYLAALTGKGADLATANDYLAARDAELMGHVFELLGLTVGVVCATTSRDKRRQAYQADVTYSTAKEIGFDFLRDRLLNRSLDDGVLNTLDEISSSDRQPVQRPLNFVVVDEADSILIDEARTPLIISSMPDDTQETRHLYNWSATATKRFEPDVHFEFDPQTHATQLTVAGRRLAQA